ncbi:hypothetical protein ULVI_01645 [Cochleicola gelatinilyticus]|uniref:Secretion system C-terminal sorting domain-containing protein n=2 Tax=Cochleicola gelatinilyticus TaxID=1763537 RepID=A0A167KA13_9FLAO|nr:hypothetical protein ULVI_01645 [Cochleicola gelatinilyticus]
MGMNVISSSPNTDGFAFVATENIPNGEVIYFTSNEYNAAGNVFTNNGSGAGEGVVIFTATSAISTGTVIFVNETSTSSDIFTVSCSGGSTCGQAVFDDPAGTSFSLSTNGDSIYAYSDTNANPFDSIGQIYSVMYTGTGEAPSQNGGDIPANENPISDFPNAIVVDGFPDDGDDFNGPGRVEFMFNPASLRDGVSQIGLENPNSYLSYAAPQALSIVPFTNLNLSGADPLLTLTATPVAFSENNSGVFTYTFNLAATASGNLTVNFAVGGSAVFNNDYTVSGANTFNGTTGSVVIPNGSNTASFTIDPTGDIILEPDETISITIINGTGYDPGTPSSATTTIVNDDTDATQPLVAITGLNHESTAPDVDGFSFVALEDIPGGTTIYFTEREYSTTSLTFSGVEGVMQTQTTGVGLSRGDVVVFTETGTGTDTFTVTCNGGSCSTITVVSGNFAVDSGGESFYAYSDANTNPNDGVTAVYALLYTGESFSTGGNVPSNEDPQLVYSNAVVVDGFPSNPVPGRTEYNPSLRNVNVDQANFQNTTNWIFGGNNQTLSDTPFSNIIITTGSADPSLSITVSPSNVIEDSGNSFTYTFTLSEAATQDITANFTVGGNATFGSDYTVTGASSFTTTNGNVLIATGNTSATITITPTTDTTVEPLENILLQIDSGIGYIGGSPNSANVTITNDDAFAGNPIVAVTGLNHLSPDGFSFVAADELLGGTSVYFTENKYNTNTLQFENDGEGVVVFTAAAGAIAKGDVIVIKETSPDVFSISCNGNTDAACGTFSLLSGNLAVDSAGESFYAYADTDNDPFNGITEIYAVLYTGDSGGPSGGDIPALLDPSLIYANAIVVDGFPAVSPDKVEYDPALRNVTVDQANFENPSNWIFGQANTDLSTVPFADIAIIDEDPIAVCQDATVQLDANGIASVTAAQIDGGSNDVEGPVTLTLLPTETISQPAHDTNNLSLGHGQSFTPTTSGSIDKIRFYVNGNTSGRNIHFYNSGTGSGAAGSVGTPAYTETNVDFVDSAGGTIWTEVTLTTSFPVIAGNTYSFILEGTTDIYYAGSNLYPDGDFIFNYDLSSGCCTFGDIAFEIDFVETLDCSSIGTPVSVGLLVTDTAGNTATCTAMVTVEDNVAPVLACTDYTVQLDETGQYFQNFENLLAASGATDNCGIMSFNFTGPNILTCAQAGTFPITIFANDINGNQSQCTVNITVIGNPTEYVGGTWSNGDPTPNSHALITDNYSTAAGSIDACTCEVSEAAELTVAPATFLKIQGDIMVRSGGSLTVEHEGSVVQINDAAVTINEGAISVLKNITNIDNRAFMIGSSPMTASTKAAYGAPIQFRNHLTGNFSPNQDVVDEFPLAENFADDNGDNWQHYNGTMNPGEGYLIMPQTIPTIPAPEDYTFNFTEGTLNNGTINFNVVYNGTQNASPNMLGNPYASAIDADVFIGANSMLDVVYFWEHLTSPFQPVDPYPGYNNNNYDMGDISMYSAVIGGNPAANGGATPNQYIASGQGFGIKALSAGMAEFNNSMRVTDNNDTFRRNTATRDRVWLTVYNNTYELGSTTLIGFSETTTDAFDAGADIKRLATAVSLYTELETGEQLGIQGRKPFETSAEVPVSFGTQIDETQSYTISIREVDGELLQNEMVYLIDHQTGTFTNLVLGNYTFVANAGDYSNRFSVVFEDRTLAVEENVLETISIYPNPTKNILYVVSPHLEITHIEVVDIRGRIIIKDNSGSNQIDLSSLDSAVYFIKITTENGTLTKRVIKS